MDLLDPEADEQNRKAKTVVECFLARHASVTSIQVDDGHDEEPVLSERDDDADWHSVRRLAADRIAPRVVVDVELIFPRLVEAVDQNVLDMRDRNESVARSLVSMVGDDVAPGLDGFGNPLEQALRCYSVTRRRQGRPAVNPVARAAVARNGGWAWNVRYSADGT